MDFKNTFLPVQTTLQSRGRLLNLELPVVMGILNATPDSFYNKGAGSDPDSLLRTAGRMLAEGAAMLDIGGASSSPGSEMPDVEEELRRVIPVVEAIHREFPDAWLSVDTFHSRVAREAVEAGAYIINDISSGLWDADMLASVAVLQVPYIAMHMQGIPETMQRDPRYEDVTTEVRDALRRTADRAVEAGIRDVILDPGFGFGKTAEHNFQLLRELHTLRMCGKPVLAGISRKAMVWRTLGVTPEAALNGTTALHMAILMQGASVLRVHDVKEAVEVIALWKQVMNLAG